MDMHYIPPTIRAVFFDAVGTLLHPDPSAADAYAAAGGDGRNESAEKNQNDQ